MKNVGLGDVVEDVIKIFFPTLAEKYKDCKGCKNRKRRLNNLLKNNKNANFK